MISIKPNCIIAGAAKSGTTYMVKLLAQHPDICTPRRKELTFFTDDAAYGNPDEFLMKQYSSYNHETIILDNTPEYMLKSHCAERIFKFSGPGTKLVFMVRQPAKRAFSHWSMMRLMGLEDDSFSAAVIDEINEAGRGRPTYMPDKRVPRDYVKRGLYLDSINHFLKFFPRDNMHIVVFEEFIVNPESILKDLLEFLDIDESFKFNLDTSSNERLNAVPTFLTRPVHGLVYLLRKRGMNISHETLYKIRKFTSRSVDNAPTGINPKDYDYLTTYFMDSINQLEKAFSLDLSVWKTPSVK